MRYSAYINNVDAKQVNGNDFTAHFVAWIEKRGLVVHHVRPYGDGLLDDLLALPLLLDAADESAKAERVEIVQYEQEEVLVELERCGELAK